ncbi:MAG TPA: UDP-glucuronic acid decarboxylase family protein [Gemmatimonadaceae bacterium]|nr:UDP-glucuronic acid decarboxylase family protein [Gemmatimonadaceae bacterium]
MRALITGAAGFLGSHLCDRFLREGWEVVGIDNMITGHRANLDHLANESRFELVEVSIAAPVQRTGALRGRFDGVLHFASLASPIDYLEHPIETLDAGSAGTRNSLEIARADGARFFLASTSEVYGDPLEHPQRETYWGNVNPVGPRSCYDESKRFAEALTMAFHRVHGVDTRIVRIFNTYGPRMRPRDGRVVSNFIVQALTGEPITIYGDGSQTRSFCYVDDEIEGIYRLYDRGDAQPTNIGNPGEYDMRQLANAVVELTGTASRVIHEPLPQDDPRLRKPDITRARTMLEWEPKVPLREGLTRTIEYFRGLLGTERMLPRDTGAPRSAVGSLP